MVDLGDVFVAMILLLVNSGKLVYVCKKNLSKKFKYALEAVSILIPS